MLFYMLLKRINMGNILRYSFIGIFVLLVRVKHKSFQMYFGILVDKLLYDFKFSVWFLSCRLCFWECQARRQFYETQGGGMRSFLEPFFIRDFQDFSFGMLRVISINNVELWRNGCGLAECRHFSPNSHWIRHLKIIFIFFVDWWHNNLNLE